MKKITDCLNEKLINICERTIQLETLNVILKPYLPLEIQDHCHVGGFTQGCLLLIIDNQIWGTQLRFMIPELRDRLRKDAGLYNLSSIKVSVMCPAEIPKIHTKNKKQLSIHVKKNILSKAHECSYPPLQKALYKLGREDMVVASKFDIHQERT